MDNAIVLCATFILLILFLSYLGIKIKQTPKREHFSFDPESDQLQQLTDKINELQNSLDHIEKQVKTNSSGVNDYLKNKKEFEKSLNSVS